MANVMNVRIKVTGNAEALETFWAKLKECGLHRKTCTTFKELGDRFGIDMSQIEDRGELESAWRRKRDGVPVISIDASFKWGYKNDLMEAVNHQTGDGLSISYRGAQSGEELFIVHDEGGFFPEECCVDAYEGPFPYMHNKPFMTVDDAIDCWCRYMRISREGRSTEEMLRLIEGTPVGEEGYFFINKYERV